MPPFGLISRSNLVRALRKAGFEGPFAGGSMPSWCAGISLFRFLTHIAATSDAIC